MADPSSTISSASQAAPAASNTSGPAASASQSQPSSDPVAKNENSSDALSMQQQEEASLDAEINPATTTQPETNTTADPSPSQQTQQPAATQQPGGGPSSPSQPAVLEPRVPAKKDASLREFLRKTDDYAPLIPDAVTDYYLTLAGLPPPPETDRKLARLLALATQKFVADIAADAYQYSRIRSTNTTSNNPLTGLGGAAGFGTGGNVGGGGGEDGAGGAKGKKDAGKAQALGGPRAGYGGGGSGAGVQGRTVLTMEDLGMAVGEYGVNVKRGEFYR